MKMTIYKPLLWSIIFSTLTAVPHAFAEDEPTKSKEEIEAPTGVGPDKGVLEASKDKGFKLSEKAFKSFGIKTAPTLPASGGMTVPLSALLAFQSEFGIYRFRDGLFKLIELKSKDLKREGSGKIIRVSTNDLRPGDQIAVGGAELLRLTDLNIWGGEEGGE